MVLTHRRRTEIDHPRDAAGIGGQEEFGLAAMPCLARQKAIEHTVEVLDRLHQGAQFAVLHLRVDNVMLAFGAQPWVRMGGSRKAEGQDEQQE